MIAISVSLKGYGVALKRHRILTFNDTGSLQGMKRIDDVKASTCAKKMLDSLTRNILPVTG